MRKKIAIICGSLAVVGTAVAGGYWFVHLNQPDVTSSTTSGGSIALNSAQTSLDSGSTVPLKNDQTTTSGSSGSSASSSATGLQVNPPASSSSGNSSSQETNFKDYEQYKSNQVALYGDITKGAGAEAVAGKKLTVNYRGWLTSGKVFDDSYAKGKPFNFVPGEHKVILGWEEGVVGMRVGGKRRLIVPPSVGYGNQTYGPIPANSVLVFDIELLNAE